MSKRRWTGLAALVLLAAGAFLLLRNRGGGEAIAPPRAGDTVPAPALTSSISVPIDADPRAVRAAIERAVPKVLWSIEQHLDVCVPPKRVKVFGQSVAVTPKLGCTVIGRVTRGPIRLRGVGRDIYVDLPIAARISARNVGGILKQQTATGTALAHAIVRLDIGADWKPRGTVRLSYDWKDAPGIDFLGQRITFTDQADAKLKPIARQLEQTLPRELAQLDVRRQVARLWRQGFTSVILNGDRPPVWMRIAPQHLRYDSYALNGKALRLNLAIDAVTETFVGPRPTDPVPTPLPPLEVGEAPTGFKFFIPTIADYAQLEPVVMRALARRSQQPFVLPGLGPVTAQFEQVTIYGTVGHQIAVGLKINAWPVATPDTKTHGTVWLTATPVNAPGSAHIDFRDLTLTGGSDRVAADLLLTLANNGSVLGAIGGALGQNFTGDLTKLLAKVRAAIAQKQLDDFVIRAQLDRVETGRIVPYGQGLYLPVRVSGAARISYRPRR